MSAKKDLYEDICEAADRGHTGLVCHLSEQYLLQFPGHGPTLIYYAEALRLLSRYALAEKILEQAECVVPAGHLHLVLYQRGHLLHRQGKWKAAEDIYIEGAHLSGNDAGGWIYAGASAFRSGDVERAKFLTRKATSCSDGCLEEAWFNLGGYLLSTKDYEEARDCYLKALLIDPDWINARKRLADLELILTDLTGSSRIPPEAHDEQ